jgi:hypothetical protein
VKRNLERFPDDFMFRLTDEEARNWISQFVISNKEKMGLRKNPYAFTEQGVAMLSSALKSRVAIFANIQIIRTFIRLKEAILSHKDIWLKIHEMEKKYDTQFQAVFKAIKLLLEKNDNPSKRFDA